MTARRWLILSGAIACAVLTAAGWWLGPDLAQRNLNYATEMQNSIAYESQSLSRLTPDGRADRTPAAFTIARGQMPLGYEATPEDAVRAGQELHNPFSPRNPKALARGRIVYQEFCQVCHGVEGAGDGPLVAWGVPALSLTAEHAVGLPDGQIFHITSYGQNTMAAHAFQVPRPDRWNVLLFVRALQRRANTEGAP